jgi:putative transposase
VKVACVVRTGGRRKRTHPGTSPTAYRHHRLRRHAQTPLRVLHHRTRVPPRAPARDHRPPHRARATQLTREPTWTLEDSESRFTHPIRNRDTKFTDAFNAVFNTIDINIVKTAPQTPRMNAYAERLVHTVRTERTDRVLIAGPRHLHLVLDEFIKHYNAGRSHQRNGLALHAPNDGSNAIASPAPIKRIQRRTVLGGLANEYQQTA